MSSGSAHSVEGGEFGNRGGHNASAERTGQPAELAGPAGSSAVATKTAPFQSHRLLEASRRRQRQARFVLRSQRGLSYVSWPRALTFKRSVLPALLLPVGLVVLWSVGISVLTSSNLLIEMPGRTPKRLRDALKLDAVMLTVLTSVMSLMLVFRNNSAYSRFNEGRKLLAAVVVAARNTARLARTARAEQILFPADNSKAGAANGDATATDALNVGTSSENASKLVQALRAALSEVGGYINSKNMIKIHKYYDLSFLEPREPDQPPAVVAEIESEGFQNPHSKSSRNSASAMAKASSVATAKAFAKLMRIQGLFTAMTEIILKMRELKQLLPGASAALLNQIYVLNESCAQIDRIRDTPVPLAYKAHAQQILFLYLLLLPFQVLDAGFVTVLICAGAAFTMCGVYAIGTEVINPFGTDANDIDVKGILLLLDTELESSLDFEKHGKSLDEDYSWEPILAQTLKA